MSLMDILNQFTQAGRQPQDDDVDQIYQHAPDGGVFGPGIAEALRSDQTPPMPDMVSNLFGRSNPMQQAGMLNQIIAALGPAALSSIAGGVLGRMLRPGQTQITPDQASQMSPTQVRDVVAAAEQRQPGIADQFGDFYAKHPELVKGLGAAALAIALGAMRSRMNQR